MPDRNEENARREQAFLSLITYAEFARHIPDHPYNIRFGGFYFWNMSSHPKQSAPRWGKTSTAAGAFMIDERTYEEAVAHGIAHDFHEVSQRAIALWILRGTGALPHIWDGDVKGAIGLARRRWPSLPGGHQAELTEMEAENYFWSQLGEERP